jgi:hypothetical protein
MLLTYRLCHLATATLASLALLVTATLTGAVAHADEPSGERVVLKRIMNVDLKVQESDPPSLTVVVTAQVPTGGWRNARLVAVPYDKPPADGMQDYILLAEKPTGAATQVISKITAEHTLRDYTKTAPWLKGVRVHGVDRGVMEKKLP